MTSISTAKPKKKKKAPTRIIPPVVDTRDEIGSKLNVNQDLFCHYYVQNFHLRGNATLCYAEAYGYDLDSLSKDDAVYAGKGKNQKKMVESSFKRAESVCAVNGGKLLRNTKIQARMLKLYNSLLTDDVVDGELAKLILQNDELGVKTGAIREYNKLKGRIIDKKMLTDEKGKSIPITTINVIPLNGTGPNS